MQRKRKLRSTRNVLVGRNGWLFLRGDSNNVIRQHKGEIRLSRRQLNQWAHLLQGHIKYCRDRKILLSQLVVPDPHSVMSAYFPHAKDGVKRPIHQLLAMAKSNGINLLYPHERLKDTRHNTYVKNDTHWSDYGAYVATKVVLEDLKIVDRVKEVVFHEQPFAGDLGTKLHPVYYDTRVTAYIKQARAKVVYDSRIHNIGTRVIYKNSQANLPRCVLFGNSYALDGFLPFLAEQFSETHFIFDVLWDYDLLEAIRPDVIITQYLERFITTVPDEKLQIKARCRAAMKIHHNYLRQAHSQQSLAIGKKLGLSECFLYQAIIDLYENNRPRAVKNFHKAVSIEKNMDFFYVFALVLKHHGHYSLAENYLEKCYEDDPTNVNVLSEYAHVLHLVKKTATAKRLYKYLGQRYDPEKKVG